MNALLIFSITSPLVPILIGIWKKRFNVLWCYAATGFFFDVVNTSLKRLAHMKNGAPANLFLVVEFIMVSLMFRRKIVKSNAVFVAFILLLSLLFLYQCLQGVINFWDIPFNMEGGSFFLVMYIFYGVAGLYTIIKEKEIIILGQAPFFWLNVAILIYAGGALPLFLFKAYIIKGNTPAFLLLWYNVFCIVNILKYLLVAVVIYYSAQSRKREFS